MAAAKYGYRYEHVKICSKPGWHLSLPPASAIGKDLISKDICCNLYPGQALLIKQPMLTLCCLSMILKMLWFPQYSICNGCIKWVPLSSRSTKTSRPTFLHLTLVSLLCDPCDKQVHLIMQASVLGKYRCNKSKLISTRSHPLLKDHPSSVTVVLLTMGMVT